MNRWKLVNDCGCWYLIPMYRQEEWLQWQDSNSALPVPTWALDIQHPQSISFENWRME